MSIEETNKQCVKNFIKAMNAGDTQTIVDTYADDGYLWTMGNTLISGKYTKAQISQAAGAIFEAFPKGITFTILAMTAEGERVAVEAESEGEHVSGKLYSNRYHFLFEFRNGKLLVLKEYLDTERVTEILCGGQKPPPDPDNQTRDWQL